jgi:hypothetical protein
MCYYTNPHSSQKVQKTKQATKKKISTSDYLRNEFIGHVNTSELLHLYFYSVYNIQIQQADDLFILLFHQNN